MFLFKKLNVHTNKAPDLLQIKQNMTLYNLITIYIVRTEYTFVHLEICKQ